jgi:hypothetical protein
MQDFRKFLAARLAKQQKEGEAHPTADVLTAFAEARLPNGERQQVLQHLAICLECREVLALTAGDVVSTPAEKAADHRWWNLRWAAALAAACVVGVVIWHSNSLPRAAPQPPTPVQAAEPASQLETPKPAKPTPALVAHPKLPRRPNTPPAVPSSSTSAVIPSPPPVAEIAKSAQDTNLSVLPAESLKAMAFQNSRPTPMKAFARASRRQSLWAIIPSNGVLQKSGDEGRTWTTIPLDARTKFLALSVSGADIWAGGEGGALFHSTDDGFEWKEVPVSENGERLKDSIIGIETQGLQVKVRTKSGSWISPDDGVTWRKMGE